MDTITGISAFLRPKLYLRESQIARLFLVAFEELKAKESRHTFEEMLSELVINDASFFIRLAKSDTELMIWLMDAAPSIFDDGNEKYQTGAVYISGLRERIDPIIKNYLHEFSCSKESFKSSHNKTHLKKIIEENQSFFELFRKRHPDCVNTYKNFCESNDTSVR